MTVKIKGGPELQAFLSQLPPKLVKNVARGAMRAGAKVIQDEARVLVPQKSGQLRKAIKVSTNVDAGVVTSKVKLRGKHSFLGVMVEYGTAAHFISVKKPKKIGKPVKRSLVIDGHFVGPTVWHPGTARRPFMRPALDTKASQAINAIGAYFAHRLTMGDLSAPVLEAEDDG